MARTARATVRDRLGAFFGVPFRSQTYLNVLYLSLAFPLGLAYVIFLSIGLGLGVGLAVVVVGIPLLVLVVAVSLGLATFERALASVLLDLDVDGKTLPADASLRDRATALATDLGTLKTLVYLPTKLAFGIASFVVVTTVLTTGVSMLLVPLYYDQPGLYVGIVTDRPVELHPTLYLAWNKLLVGFEAVWTIDAWRVSTLAEALVVAVVGGVLVLGALHLLNVLAAVSKRYTAFMLGDSYDVVDELRTAADGAR